MAKYPEAKSVAALILEQTARGRPLEVVLKDFFTYTDHRAKQVVEIAPYLREVFGEVSARYTKAPSNYSNLVSPLLANCDRVAFVTTNYDLLLETQLTLQSVGGPTLDLGWYVQSGWMLIKLHGSVNWARPLLNYQEALDTIAHLPRYARGDPYLHLLSLAGVKDNLSPEIALLEDPTQLWRAGVPYYPTLVVPVEGKYDFDCPTEHVGTLRAFLRSCSNVLVIGSSGRDKDLTDLLAESLSSVAVFDLVAGSEEDYSMCVNAFASAVPALARATMIGGGSYDSQARHVYTKGFSAFIRGEGVERFMERARLA